MPKENTFPHLVGDAIQTAACLIGLLLGTVLCCAAVYSFAVYRTDIDTVKLWCAKTNACTATPTLFGSSVIRVFDDKQLEARALVVQLFSDSRTPVWAKFEPFTVEIVSTRQPKAQDASKSTKKKG